METVELSPRAPRRSLPIVAGPDHDELARELAKSLRGETDFDAIIARGGPRAEIYANVREFRDRYAPLIRRGFPNLPRRVSGDNLPALLPENGTQLVRALVGSEGTLITIVQAKLRLVPSPPVRVLLVLGYPTVFESVDHIMEVRESRTIGLEGIDEVLVEDMKKKRLHPGRLEILPDGRSWLLVEFGGETRAEAEAKAKALIAELKRSTNPPSMKLFDDPFVRSFRERPAQRETLPQVLLWVDTFNNHFQPEVLRAAVDVLEDAGFHVLVPARSVCCGRPLYDYGMLSLAKRTLRNVLDELRPTLRAGIPIVGLEPSCISVFRDELSNLFPEDEDARRLAHHSFLLSDFLLHHASGWRAPALSRHDRELFDAMGLGAEELDAGCCGMAGGFGYERGHYDVSVACAERKLVPAVEHADPATLIVADGFSCREQIRQQTGREALHSVQLLQIAACKPA